ncbi:hypothetical protein [Streptomyces sp. A0592]|uniref:hypothetical protein n=1 Tax=Streptomyces sp. A0592 TaxID=2563099 RepID=UPI00109E8DAF|nr:hypothetical protein [Streptomyces sp. A0592]THA86226.1 hypothetical protein E6U81_04340 [Streptomyces sp. A0592]
MTKLLLSVHVLAAILAIGPIAVAASMFPRYTRTPSEDAEGLQTAKVLHRICRGYTLVGVAVPVFGVATGARLGVLTDAWLLVSIVLTAAAAALLALAILPGQQRLLGGPEKAGAARLAMVTGVFNLLWAVVVVLMIVRPGSTTGA